MKRPNRKARKAAKVIFVALYAQDRAYGGPEEGGWWYDTGSLIPGTAETFFNEDNAHARCRALNEAICEPDNERRGSRGNLGSVLCDYALAAEVHRGSLPAYYPTHRPYYE